MSEEEQIKRMAGMVRSGAIMLFKNCPDCSSPLFKINEDIWCLKCNKKVIIIKDEADIQDFTRADSLNRIEELILDKLQKNSQKIKFEDDPEKEQQLGNLLTTWLEVLERIKRLRNLFEHN